MSAGLEVRALTLCVHGKAKVKDVSFSLQAGQIFGVLSRDAALSSQLLRCVATLQAPAAGQVLLNGVNVYASSGRLSDLRRSLGYVTAHTAADERLTVREYLEFYAAAYQVPQHAVSDVLELLELPDFSRQWANTLTAGPALRLQLARALLADPALLILDDPARKLDLRTRAELADLLLQLSQLGKMVLLSSSKPTPLDAIFQHVGVLEPGRFRQLSTAHDSALNANTALNAAHAEATSGQLPLFAARSAAPVEPAPSALQRHTRIWVLHDVEKAAQVLRTVAAVQAVQVRPPNALEVRFYGSERSVAACVSELVRMGLEVVGVEHGPGAEHKWWDQWRSE